MINVLVTKKEAEEMLDIWLELDFPINLRVRQEGKNIYCLKVDGK